MNKITQKKILIADDHAVVRQGLRTLLEQAGYEVIAEAGSGEQACLLLQELHPDIVLLDLDMPGVGGLEALKRMLARNPSLRILIFSMHDDHVYATRAVQAGAKGYIVKTDAPEKLLEAVQKIIGGGCYVGHEIAQSLVMHKFYETENPVSTLSPREFEVFRRISEGQSLSKMATQLQIGYKTAANIQTQVRQKMGAETTGQLVHLAIRFGIIQSRE
jgi:DNA-binding NarL/FixJ family response regulator